jgi:trehalose 6-phosphate phosphatase
MPLPVPLTPAGVAGLAELVDHPEQAMLVFDFDGVLSPIVPDPSQARPHPRTMTALARLAIRTGWVAVITGRSAQTAVDYGGFARIAELANLVVFGGYGSQRWDARTGEIIAPPPPTGVASARAALPRLLARVGAPDVWVEDKGGAVAVHTRRSPHPEAALALLREPVAELAAEHGLIVEPGRLVLELRPPGIDKGAALRGYVAECSPGSLMYCGDDLGDLPAFAAVNALRSDGLPGLAVCSGSTENEEVARHADLVVDGPPGIADLLEGLADAALARAHRS